MVRASVKCFNCPPSMLNAPVSPHWTERATTLQVLRQFFAVAKPVIRLRSCRADKECRWKRHRVAQRGIRATLAIKK